MVPEAYRRLAMCPMRLSGFFGQLGPTRVERVGFGLRGIEFRESFGQLACVDCDVGIAHARSCGVEASFGSFHSFLDAGKLAGFEVGEFLLRRRSD